MIGQTIERRPAAARRPRVLRVALAGCGNVGGALLAQLRDRRSEILRSHDIGFEVVRVLIRDPARVRDSALSRSIVTTDVHAFNATDADIVVEAIGGVETAALIADAALRRGASFVTANKALLASRGAALAALARRAGGKLSFEAAVAGGVPVLRVLRDALPHAGVRSIRGILNGTTNYILTRMDGGASFDAALAEAQARGFAEADPTRDLDGRDAADKVAVLAWQAFGLAPDSATVECRGLLPDPARLAATASALGGSARLLGEALIVNGGVACVVEPVIVARDSFLARVAGEENVVEVETSSAGTIRLSGPGAGGAPTASAVLADMIAAAARPPDSDRSRTGSAADTRRHRWAIAVPAAARHLLPDAAARTRVPLVGHLAAPELAIATTGPHDRAAVGAFARALELHGTAPLLLRLEV